MNLTEQLKRDGNLLARPTKSPRPRKPLPKQSKKRQGESREYAKKRKAFLLKHRYCQVGAVWLGRSPCRMMATDIHHTRGRIGKNYLDESTWLTSCRPCHDYLHRNPKEARALGLLA